MLYGIIKLLIGIVAFINFIGPLIVYKIVKLPAIVKFDPIEEDEFRNSCSSKLLKLDPKIRELGFEYIGSSCLIDDETEAYFSLYNNKQEMVFASLATLNSKTTSFTYTEFTQMYADDTILDVNNTSQVPAFPYLESKITTTFPEYQEPSELFAIFKKLKTKLKNTAQAINFESTYFFEPISRMLKVESDEMVKLGYCKKQIDEEGKRALTLKGAYLTTWRSIFPGKYIKKIYDKRYSKALLKQ